MKAAMLQSKHKHTVILHFFFGKFSWLTLNEIYIFSPADSSLLQKIIRKGLIDSKSELDIIRQDPNSPLYSAKTFEELKLYVCI